ncbi:hybrid sensor histidine kinase/response regulator [Trinickia dabaoshanensis]|uniref:histidine kinase n=1 Tax=Trinickia dabaoshanensis TaxID=564714 RepID=A0A2N7VUP3_9BURK|nr:PAS domain-containing sensor histidine kinase [Trinickia dabaoshanensis]PMS20868.1 hybrid sensor histidine kinase/response regulator [Trinickia dabaoshanensis]
MKCPLPYIGEHTIVRGTELHPDDPAELTRNKLAHVILSEISAFVALLSPSGTVLDCNNQGCRALQLPQTEVIGRPLADVFPHAPELREAREALRQAVARAAAGETVRLDLPMAAAASGASASIIDATLRPVRDDQGHVAFVLMEAREATQQRSNEAALAASRAEAHRGHEASARLQETEQRFRLLVDSVVDYAIFMLDRDGYVTSWNSGAQRIKGYQADEIIGQHFSRFYTEEDRRDGVPGKVLARAASTGKFEGEGWRVRKDGTHFWANVLLDAIVGPDGEVIGFAKVTRDLTEKRNVEAQLRQSQKMEAIGQLTGGIAHDFNNLLQVVIGSLEGLQRRVGSLGQTGQGADMTRFVENALRGADRAANLTRRLLAFSRRQTLDAKPTDITKLVAGMSDLLRRTLGEAISIEAVNAAELWRVSVDANQLESALLNLAVNARDAMPGGGKLTIETANCMLDESYVTRFDGLDAGPYVMIAVSDTGTGMSKEVLERAMEPFFTTKEVGHGTGLGLSQVYGFVKQSGGHVRIYSELTQGTTVKLFLPRLAGDAAVDERPDHRPVPASRVGETILVVEDDENVRTATSEMLRELGYRVLAAADGPSALHLVGERPEIRLLFTDVGLPGGMNGRQLADAVRTKRPELPVLFTTGYARNAIVHHGRLDAGIHLLSKPFTYAELADKLSRMLADAPSAPRH